MPAAWLVQPEPAAPDTARVEQRLLRGDSAIRSQTFRSQLERKTRPSASPSQFRPVRVNVYSTTMMSPGLSRNCDAFPTLRVRAS